MPDDRAYWLDILRSNVGFGEPERWADYARTHAFTRVTATPVEACPDCGCPDSRPRGQYVHYSTLIRLRLCAKCGLAYSDAHLDPAVIQQHFELAYKDEQYFSEQRAAIFDFIGELVARSAPRGASVLDIGGAQGHLLASLCQRRPDLRGTLLDLSSAACDYAKEHFGLRAIPGSFGELQGSDERFDVVLLIDVAYYEPDIRGLWETLSRITEPGGMLVIRVPNNLFAIRLDGALRQLTSDPAMADHIRFFNPEHVLAFSRDYLGRRLRGLGFDRIEFHPSPFLARAGIRGSAAAALYQAGAALHALTRGRAVVTPAMVVVARRAQRNS